MATFHRTVRCTLLIAAVGVVSSCAGSHTPRYDPPPLRPTITIPPRPETRLGSGPATIDVSAGLRPDEVGWLTLAASPVLESVRAERSVAGAQIVVAGILPNPLIALGFDNPIGGPTANTVSAFSAGISWQISDLIARSARVQSAEEGANQIAYDVAWQEWQAFFTAQRLAWQVIAQAEIVKIEQNNLDDLQHQYTQTKTAEAKGVESEGNTLSAAAALEAARVRVLDAQQELRRMKIAVAEGFGHPELDNVRILGSLVPPTWTATIAAAPLLAGLEQRLDIAAFGAALRSQNAAERAAALRGFPSIDIGGNVARDTGNLLTAGVSLTVGLPTFDRGQADTAIARATQERIAWERTARLTNARAAVRTLLLEVKTSRSRIEVLEGVSRTRARLVAIYRAALDRGLVDAAAYYVVRGDDISLQIDVVRARLALRTQLLELSAQAGAYPLGNGERP